MTPLYWFILTMTRAAFSAICSWEVIGREKRIESGGAIIAANHSSFLDPPIVACSYSREISFLARSTLFRGPGRWLYPKLNAFPIDREHADLKSMKLILKKLKEGKRVLIFPEGTRTRDGSLQESKPGIGMLVAKSGVPVQPVRILGTYQSWPRGGRFRPHKLTVIIGDPVRFSEEDLGARTREGYQRIANQLMNAIGELKP